VTPANRAALASVRARAERMRERDLARIARAGVELDVAPLLDAAVVTLNFHPDRLLADGRTVADGLYDDGVYRSQYETGISNGGLTAFPGGDRDEWERALFGGAYEHAAAAERPKYGGLNLLGNADGACPGFGSCHLRLRPAANGQATLIFGDSSGEPADIGLIDAFEPVLAPLLEAAAAGRRVLERSLDGYVEAQVHGVVSLPQDVAALVIDAAFQGTQAGARLLEAAARYGITVEWHGGMVLEPAQVPADAPSGTLMRWQALCADGRARRLAERVAEEHGPRLDAAAIGRAAADMARRPERWREWGTPAELLLHLKDLWRIVLTFGERG
jgi:hypothetical protein